MPAELLSAALAGLTLAVRFNPIASLAGSIVGAVLVTRSERLGGAALVVGAAWLIGDGGRIALHVAGVVSESGGSVASNPITPSALTLGVWAVAGLVLGYVIPVWAGTYVGRRVTHGTGWLAAGAVAAAVSAGIVTMAARLPL